MKLFAAFIWFYLRILPSEKATFCAPRSIRSRYVQPRSADFIPSCDLPSKFLCFFKTAVLYFLFMEIIQLVAINVHDKRSILSTKAVSLVLSFPQQVEDFRHFALGLRTDIKSPSGYGNLPERRRCVRNPAV